MFKSICTALLMTTVIGCASINLNESTLIHPNNSYFLQESLPKEYQYSEYKINREDGSVSYGVSIINPKIKVTVMYFGGNTFDVSSQGGTVMDSLAKSNVNVIMFDRRGYGRSLGKPTVSLLMKDAIDNYDYARNLIEGHLIIHGHSLGSFEAGYVSSNRKVDGVILEASATNVDEWSSTLIPWFAKPFINIEISNELKQVNNLSVVKEQKAPLLVIVGENDDQTPKFLSEKLYNVAKSPNKDLYIFKNSNHNNVIEHDEFNSVYDKFIAEKIVL
jgi:esterase/lipase